MENAKSAGLGFKTRHTGSEPGAGNTASLYLLYMIAWVLFRQGHSCQHALVISCGAWEARSANTEPTCSPILHHTVPQPWPPEETRLTAALLQTACVPEFMMATYRRPFTLKVILSFPSLAVCVASVNPLTFRADTYGGLAFCQPWALTVFDPPLTTNILLLPAPSHSQPPHNTVP